MFSKNRFCLYFSYCQGASPFFHNSQCLQSWDAQSLFFCFQFKDHFLISLMILIKSFPLSVKVYSHLIGKTAVSMLFAINPCRSSSLSRSERILGVISRRLPLSSEYRFVPCVLYSS